MTRNVLGIVAGALAFAGVASGAQAQQITITADQWCPYNCEPGSDAPGYVVEIAERIYEAEGYTINYTNMPWSRALAAGAAGDVHGVIAVSFQPETEEMVLPEEPLTVYEIHAVTRADDTWNYEGVDSLEGKTPAVVFGYNYGDEFTEWQEANEDKLVVNRGDGALEQNFRMVQRGRADFAIDGLNVLRYSLNEAGMTDDFRFAGVIGEAVPLYLGFSKKAGDADKLARMWTDGVREMRGNGELETILSKYGVGDWDR